MASVSKLDGILSALILHNEEVTVTEEDNINALIKAAGVNVEPFWPVLFAKSLATVNIGRLICNVGAGGPTVPAGGPAPATAAAPAEEKKVGAKKEESEESEDDLGFGVFG